MEVRNIYNLVTMFGKMMCQKADQTDIMVDEFTDTGVTGKAYGPGKLTIELR